MPANDNRPPDHPAWLRQRAWFAVMKLWRLRNGS